jgi:hypothetical protein
MNSKYHITNIIHIAIVIALFSFGCSRNTDVPGELIGVWETSAPKYADRHLAFDEYYVTLGLGAGEEVSYIIKNIEAKQENGGTAYTFDYEDSEGEDWTLAFYFEAANDGLIILNNSDNVWKKVKSGE